MNRILAIATLALISSGSWAQDAAWLDELHPRNWNKQAMSIPAAPTLQADTAPACASQSRPPQFREDMSVHDQGWDLTGPYQGGWEVFVIAGAAGYDGMCRPVQFQYFVFVRGAFAGTLSPEPMDSRTDGALHRISFDSGGGNLRAQYLRYAHSDALCCPSRTTNVVFEIDREGRVIRPKVATSSENH